MHNVNNNLAESYNSIIGKFVGGKRINFSLKGAYTTRCEGAALSFNSPKGLYHKKVQQKILKNGLGKYTEKYCNRIYRIRNTQRKRNYKKVQASCGPDISYGATIDNVPDMDKAQYEDRKKVFLLRLSENITEIEESTRFQASSDLWVKERKMRLTASNFGRVCNMRKTTSTKKLIESLLYSRFRGNSYTKYGQENESTAVEIFEKKTELQTKKSGLIIFKELPYLGASPDRLINDNSAIVEIKCPAKANDLTPEEAVTQKRITCCTLIEGEVRLKKNHNYMFQIQGQMMIANIDMCYFVIYTKKGMSIEIIRKDQEFCENMKTKLTTFYLGALLPELVDSRRSRNLPLRDFYMK